MTATGARRRVLVVWNRQAGSKAGLPTNRAGEDELRRAMAEHGLGDELAAPESEADATDRIRLAVEDGYDAIVAAGGDGTAGLVARQLLGKETALGILPLGSAMNVARSLGIPRELDAAAAIAGAGHCRTIDVGMAGETMFLEVASIGLSAQMFGDAQRVEAGEYGGIVALVRSLLRFQAHRIELDLDGRTVRRRAIMVAVANAPYTGLGLTLAPGARLDDGLFDVAVYGRFLRWELVRHLAGVLAGRHRYSPKITTFRAARVRVSSRRPLPVRADDADLGSTPAEFEIRPGVLRVIAPEPDEGAVNGSPTGERDRET